jgi:hypothetical protein
MKCKKTSSNHAGMLDSVRDMVEGCTEGVLWSPAGSSPLGSSAPPSKYVSCPHPDARIPQQSNDAKRPCRFRLPDDTFARTGMILNFKMKQQSRDQRMVNLNPKHPSVDASPCWCSKQGWLLNFPPPNDLRTLRRSSPISSRHACSCNSAISWLSKIIVEHLTAKCPTQHRLLPGEYSNGDFYRCCRRPLSGV